VTAPPATTPAARDNERVDERRPRRGRAHALDLRRLPLAQLRVGDGDRDEEHADQGARARPLAPTATGDRVIG
jgi:hypothetical protein